MICSLCHLNYHRKHNFKILKNMATQIKLKINMDLLELRYGMKKYQKCFILRTN